MEMRTLHVTYCVLVCCNIWQVFAAYNSAHWENILCLPSSPQPG